MFGRVSNSVGVDLDVKPGEVIFLRNLLTGEDLFSRHWWSLDELVRVFINNIPSVEEPHIRGLSDNTFHFRMYYDTFKRDGSASLRFYVPSASAPPIRHDAPPGSPAGGEHHREEANVQPPGRVPAERRPEA